MDRVVLPKHKVTQEEIELKREKTIYQGIKYDFI